MTATGRPRLLLHAGTPKTGTTTLQAALHASRRSLQAHGILYPETGLSNELKHQWMVNLLMAGDIEGFRRNVLAVLDEVQAAQAGRVVLSTEGLFLHWTDFTSEAKSEIAAMAALFDVTVWTVFREPVSFAISLYCQVLKNPPSPHLTSCYATTMEFAAAVRDPWFATRLDYRRFITEIEQMFGAGCLFATQYESGDVVAQARAVLDVDEAAMPGVPTRNQGLHATGAELLRKLNASSLDPAERQRLVDAVVAIDAVVGRGEPLVASSEARQTVEGWSGPSTEYLSRRYGIRWPQRVDPRDSR